MIYHSSIIIQFFKLPLILFLTKPTNVKFCVWIFFFYFLSSLKILINPFSFIIREIKAKRIILSSSGYFNKGNLFKFTPEPGNSACFPIAIPLSTKIFCFLHFEKILFAPFEMPTYTTESRSFVLILHFQQQFLILLCLLQMKYFFFVRLLHHIY